MFIPKKKKKDVFHLFVCLLKQQVTREGDQPAPGSRPTGRPERGAGSERTVPTSTRTSLEATVYVGVGGRISPFSVFDKRRGVRRRVFVPGVSVCSLRSLLFESYN